ncbi:hypothetical protein Gasu2_09590 [Galdieria sulphuraria]|nr:hypothetical protein Gasu2_09590 [Galdieria sulphuraria]
MRFYSTTCSDRSSFVTTLCLPQENRQNFSEYYDFVNRLKRRRFKGNSWCLQVGSLRVFVDPWLVGNLHFGPQFLFSGAKKSLKDKKLEDFGRIDLIVLSQGLPDHTHVPTLEQIDKTIPVAASRKAAEICKKLGFKNVQLLRHGDQFCFRNLVQITAYEGSRVGPPYEVPENGYLFETFQNFRLFYEPHGNVPEKVLNELRMKSLDTLVVPVVNAAVKWMGFKFDLINDPGSVLNIVRHLQPYQLVPLMNNDLNTFGLLSRAIFSKGSLEAFAQSIQVSGLRTKVINPVIGEAYVLL